MSTPTPTTINTAVTDSSVLCSRLQQLEQGVCVVNIISQAACGEKSLPKVKVELDGCLQDSDTIKGSKIRWFPKEPLNFVNKSKQQISRSLNAYGVRWGDMTIVPLARLDELQQEIENIQLEWQQDLDAMLLDFDNLVSQWQRDNLDVADIMRRYTMDKTEFGGRFKLKMLPPVAFKPLIDKEDDEAAEELANSMLDNLYEEVAKMANDVYERSFFIKDSKGHKVPRTRANRRIKDSFKTLIQKLGGLSFLDSNIEKVITETERVLNSMPKTGWIENNDLTALAHWTCVMSNAETLKNHANDDLVDYNEEVIVDDFGVLGEEISNNLDEDLGGAVFNQAENKQSETESIATANKSAAIDTTSSDSFSDLPDGEFSGFGDFDITDNSDVNTSSEPLVPEDDGFGFGF